MNSFVVATSGKLIYSCFQLKRERKSLRADWKYLRESPPPSPPSSFVLIVIIFMLPSRRVFFSFLFMYTRRGVFFTRCRQPRGFFFFSLPPYIAKDEDGEGKKMRFLCTGENFSLLLRLFFPSFGEKYQQKIVKIVADNEKLFFLLPFNGARTSRLIRTDAILINFHRL